MSKNSPIFLTMKMTFNLNNICYEVKIDDNTIKDNATVTSSNFSRNGGTIRFWTSFIAKHYGKITNNRFDTVVFSMTLDLTCAFEVIILPNKRVMALFHHFFSPFVHIPEISQKAHNTTTSRTPVPCILQILTTFNSYSGRPNMGL